MMAKYRQVYRRSGYEHIEIVQRVMGRLLPRGAEIHHVDGDGRNNAHRNLVVCQDKAYHKLLHVRTRVRAAGGNPNTDRICARCKAVTPMSGFHRRRDNVSAGLQAACIGCMNEYRRELKARRAA